MAKQQKTYSFILTALMLATMAFIWYNSLQNRDQSSQKSQALLEIIVPVLDKMSIELKDPTDDLWLRKAAHLFEFALLGGEMALFLRTRRRVVAQGICNGLFAGLLAAVSDETVQIFSGRYSCVSDVLLDYSGFIIGLLLVLMFSAGAVRKRRRG